MRGIRVRREVQNLQGDGRGKALAILALGWFLSIGVRMIYPVLLPFVRRVFELNLTTAGWLLSLLFLGYAVGQLPAGILADRFGEGAIMVVSMLLMPAALGVVASARSTVALFAATGLFGLGASLFTISKMATLTDLFPDRTGTTFGLTRAVGDLGNMALPPIAGLIASALTWELGFGFAIPLFIVTAIGILTFVPRRTSASPSEGTETDTGWNVRYLLASLSRPAVTYTTAILVLGASLMLAFLSFYPTYLIEVKGFSSTVASLVFSLLFVIGAITKVLVGHAYDRYGIRYPMIIIMLITAVGMTLLPAARGLSAITGITILIGTFLGYGALAESHLMRALPADIKGTGMGILRSGYNLIGAASPVAFGAAASRGFFDEGFLVLGGIAISVALLALRMPTE